jgi:hypothetical protein
LGLALPHPYPTGSQPHLTQRVINSVGLKDSYPHDTPAEPGKPLTKDTDSHSHMYHWSFQSVVGMLNYLCGTRPDIMYSVHQCARFCNEPKLSHKKAIKHIVHYLKRTPSEGIIVHPDSSKGIQCFVDKISQMVGMLQTVKSLQVSTLELAMWSYMQVVQLSG